MEYTLVADSEQIPSKPESGEEPAEQGGVFGNLPGSRPAVRSPRRGAGAKATGSPSRSSETKPRGSRSPRSPAARPPKRATAAEHETSSPAEAEHGGIEDLAWAGVAVAAEAATLGVRLLSRAVDAVRKPTDRR